MINTDTPKLSIYSFLEKRQERFQKENLEGSYLERIESLKTKMLAPSSGKPTVLISGGGPAGLMRAVQSLSNGNKTIVIEKRPEKATGRTNTVVLDKMTVQMLKYCGIHQYLIENGLVFPPDSTGYTTARLGDLEIAMKAVIKELSADQLICYESTIDGIIEKSNKIDVVVDSNGKKTTIPGIDILVNAEGSRSTTNDLLGITRELVLKKVPVVASIYKDERPEVHGVKTFFEYVGKSMEYTAKTIYIHVQFIFRFIFSKSFREEMSGSLILKTPMQTYLGSGFSDTMNTKMQSLKKDLDDKKVLLTTTKPGPETEKYETTVAEAEKKYNSYVESKLNFSLCHANMIAVLVRCFGKKGARCPTMSGHRTLDSFHIIEIGADRAIESCKAMGNSSILLAGDANATVDPTTGLGCNTAIQSSTDFLDFIWDFDAKTSQKQLLRDYKKKTLGNIEFIHTESTHFRNSYNPLSSKEFDDYINYKINLKIEAVHC